jgi:hypothetical protein
MVRVYDKATDAFLGEITDEQFQFLYDQLEEESNEDTDYFINVATLEMLGKRGADAGLLSILEQALQANGEGEVRWERE